MWLIDPSGAAYRWGDVYRLSPSCDNREVVAETSQYRVTLCRCGDARAVIQQIVEHGRRDEDLDLSSLDGVIA